MKNLDLNAFGVKEMNRHEMMEADGGFGLLAAITIIGAAIYVYNNLGDFVEGVKEGYQANK
jgi:hypothetical protein